jgi:hypothetical protein
MENMMKKMVSHLGGIRRNKLKLFQRKMIMYTGLTSASTGVEVDKGTKILQKMQKEKNNSYYLQKFPAIDRC